MIESIQELEDMHRKKMVEAVRGFSTFCKAQNLNETSASQLLGVSRQTWVNYKNEKSTPTSGVAMRMRLVLQLLLKAKEAGLLPVDGRQKQGNVVKQILSLQ